MYLILRMKSFFFFVRISILEFFLMILLRLYVLMILFYFYLCLLKNETQYLHLKILHERIRKILVFFILV
jgi:hypothetical protein